MRLKARIVDDARHTMVLNVSVALALLWFGGRVLALKLLLYLGMRNE